MRLKQRVLLVIWLMAAVDLHAQVDLEDLRDQLRNDVSASDIGAGYAQMLNFFMDPSISASRLETDDDINYDVFKAPLQLEIPLEDTSWQLLARGTLSHASADTSLNLLNDESINSSWKAVSGQLGLGLLVPAGEHLSWVMAGQYGVSRMENTADYNGVLSEALIAPIVDGILFNWDTNARVVSVTGGLDYRRRLADRYDLQAVARYTFSHIASYSESRDLPPFEADTGTLAVKADLKHSLGASVHELPLFGVVHLGATAFTGSTRGALGFSHFYELGYAVGLDVSARNRLFHDFTLGAQMNVGSDIEGVSLVFGWRLR